jgi:hypothetical protein
VKRERLSDFDVDLKRGEIGEEHLREILGDVQIEVKRDFITCDSGNIAVEYENGGLPSGISITKAKWWGFVLSEKLDDEVVLLVETERLKRIARYFYKRGSVKSGGDNNGAKNILIPVGAFANPRNYDG